MPAMVTRIVHLCAKAMHQCKGGDIRDGSQFILVEVQLGGDMTSVHVLPPSRTDPRVATMLNHHQVEDPSVPDFRRPVAATTTEEA